MLCASVKTNGAKICICIVHTTQYFLQYIRVADPYHCKADPDPALHFNADTDPTFHLNPDPDPHQSDVDMRPLVYRPSRAPF